MAIEYVNRQRTFPAPSGMLASQSDIELLRNYVKESSPVAAAQAAAAVVRVVQDAASASGASSESITAAQVFLHELYKDPRPEAIDDLLVICEYQVSFDIVDVFKLYSAAWKVVTGTCLKATCGEKLPVRSRLKVLSSAMAGAQNMLLEIVQRSEQFRKQHLGEDPLPALTRYLKIARFHSINAARCCKAFLKFKDLDSSSEAQLVGLMAQVLRILAYVTHACNFNERIAEPVRQDMSQNISPALGGTTRSVLSLVSSIVGKDHGATANRIVSEAFKAMVEDQDCAFTDALRTSKETIQILAALHLLRLGASETSEDILDVTAPSALQGSDGCILYCRTVFESMLLPVVFEALEKGHVEIFATRDLQTGLKFFDCISLTVEECIAMVDRRCASLLQSGRLEDLLLKEMNSRNAACALISHRVLLRLMAARKDDSVRRLRLLFVAMIGARLSLSLGTGYAERRWIPLASALALALFKDGLNIRPVFQQYQETRKPGDIAQQTNGSDYTKDVVILRVVASVCGLVLSERESRRDGLPSFSSQQKASDAELVDRVLQFAGLDKVETHSLVKRVVTTDSEDARLTEAAIHLLPYLCDGRSASTAGVMCMKRPEASIETQIRAINTLNPGLMPVPAIQNACTHATTLLHRFGSVMSAPLAAFVTRAASHLHQNVSPTEWQKLSSLLELAVREARMSTSSSEASMSTIREASVLYHAAHALHVTCTLSRSTAVRNTHATLPGRILRDVENAQARLLELRGTLRMGRGLGDADAESGRCVAEEIAAGARMLERVAGGGADENGGLVGFERMQRWVLGSAGRLVGGERGSAMEGARARRFVAEMRDLLGVLERCVEMG